MIPTNPTNEPLAQHVPLDALTPHSRNYNTHPVDQIARLRESLRTYGQPRPIVVHRGVILAGHGVYMAARAEGWRQIWCSVVPDEWSEARAIGYLVADNETRRGAKPDESALLELIEETRHEVGLEALGFDETALHQFASGKSGGAYWYTGGWNLRAVVAWLVGSIAGIFGISSVDYVGPHAELALGVDLSVPAAAIGAVLTFLVLNAITDGRR
jgi:hypothetical protein